MIWSLILTRGPITSINQCLTERLEKSVEEAEWEQRLHELPEKQFQGTGHNVDIDIGTLQVVIVCISKI